MPLQHSRNSRRHRRKRQAQEAARQLRRQADEQPTDLFRVYDHLMSLCRPVISAETLRMLKELIRTSQLSLEQQDQKRREQFAARYL